MTGPFRPEDFVGELVDLNLHTAADAANRADAKRWACPKGGEHEAAIVQTIPPRVKLSKSVVCGKCGVQLRARWEAV